MAPFLLYVAVGLFNFFSIILTLFEKRENKHDAVWHLEQKTIKVFLARDELPKVADILKNKTKQKEDSLCAAEGRVGDITEVAGSAQRDLDCVMDCKHG